MKQPATSISRSSPVTAGAALAAVLLSLAAAGASARELQPNTADLLDVYTRLRAARLEPAGHVAGSTLEVDRARFQLDDGELYLLEPVAGQTTGAVFIGRGRLTLRPPDAVERQQLAKYTDAEELDERFERAVFRFTGDVGERLSALAGPSRRADLGRASDVYRDRHEKIFDDRLVNPDARILLDLAAAARRAGRIPLSAGPAGSTATEVAAPDARGGYFLAEIDGSDLDWFTVEVDPQRREEVLLYESHGLGRARDTWSSFHLRPDYAASPPARAAIPSHEGWSPAIRIPRTRVDLAVEGGGRARAVATLEIHAERRLDVLRLSIGSLLSVTDVRWLDVASLDEVGHGVPGALGTEGEAPDPRGAGATRYLPAAGTARRDRDSVDPRDPMPPTGEPTPFVQERNGRGLDEDLWEPGVTVLLPGTVAAGGRFVLEIAYEGDLLEKRARDADLFHRDTEMWFPRYPSGGRTTFDLVFRTPERYRIATTGEPAGEEVVDGTRIARWRVTRPARGISFYCGELRGEDYEFEDAPPMTIYTSRVSRGPGDRDKTVRDFVSAIGLFSEYFGPFPYDRLRVSETPSVAGQAFPGLILLSYWVFGGMHTGEAELFRVHELAHQWWGASIGWETYRDQWMSEGFALYAAGLYAIYGLEDPDQFEDMLDAWRSDVFGRGDIGQRLGLRHYGFGPEALRKSEGFESGPVWIGYRLASDRTPVDYRVIAYEKGAFILHMLRSMLVDPDTGDDTAFRDLMRGFTMRHRGSDASTEDFLAAVSEGFGQPMDWFFDQWVYGTAVPTYEPELDLVRRDGGWALTGYVLQRDVPEGFHMPVPVRVTFEDGTERTYRIEVDAPRVEVDIDLPARPDELEFNAGSAVLAKID